MSAFHRNALWNERKVNERHFPRLPVFTEGLAITPSCHLVSVRRNDSPVGMIDPQFAFHKIYELAQSVPMERKSLVSILLPTIRPHGTKEKLTNVIFLGCQCLLKHVSLQRLVTGFPFRRNDLSVGINKP